MRLNFSRQLAVLALASVLAACGSTPIKEGSPTEQAIVLAAPSLTPALQQEYTQAVDLLKQQQFDAAKTLFEKLVKLEPRLAGAYVNLAIIAEAEGEDELAQAYFESALQHNPDNIYALNFLALEQQKLGKFREAEALFLQAYEAAPDSPQINFNLGVLYEIFLGENKKAIKHYSRYVKVSSNSNVEKVKRWIKLLERRS